MTLQHLNQKKPRKKRGYYLATKQSGSWTCTVSDGGYSNSRGKYWPASVVKLPAAVAMYRFLARKGLNGNMLIRFRDTHGSFRGSAHSLLSFSNRDFDRMVRVAGHANVTFPQYPQLYIGRAYSRGTLFTSPAMWIGKKHFARRKSTYRNPNCRRRSNCTTLSAVHSMLKRVVHLDKTLGVNIADLKVLKKALRRQRPHTIRLLHRKFKGATLYSKAGSVPRYDILDNVYINFGHTQYVITVTAPYRQSYSHAVRRLEWVVKKALTHLRTCQKPRKRK